MFKSLFLILHRLQIVATYLKFQQKIQINHYDLKSLKIKRSLSYEKRVHVIQESHINKLRTCLK